MRFLSKLYWSKAAAHFLGIYSMKQSSCAHFGLTGSELNDHTLSTHSAVCTGSHFSFYKHQQRCSCSFSKRLASGRALSTCSAVCTAISASTSTSKDALLALANAQQASFLYKNTSACYWVMYANHKAERKELYLRIFSTITYGPLPRRILLTR